MRMLKVRDIGARMEGLEKRQEEIVKLLNSLKLIKNWVFFMQCKKTIVAGLNWLVSALEWPGGTLWSWVETEFNSSRGLGWTTQITVHTIKIIKTLVFRRDSFDPSRRDSLILGGEASLSASRTFPVMEVEPWTPTQEVTFNFLIF